MCIRDRDTRPGQGRKPIMDCSDEEAVRKAIEEDRQSCLLYTSYYRQEDVPYFALDENGDRVCQWLRSANYYGNNYFCNVYTGGSAHGDYASCSLALLPGFSLSLIHI